MKIYKNEKAINREIWHLQTNPHYYAILPKYIYCLVILINFHFAHACIIKVSNKVIDILNRIYFNEYFILLSIYLVSDSGIITYQLVKLATWVVLLHL